MQPQGSNTLSVGDAIGYGWSAFKKYPGQLIVVILVIGAVNIGLNFIAGAAGNSVGIAIVFQIAGWVVSTWLTLGLIRVSLKVTRGEEPQVPDLFVTDGLGPYLGASILFGIAVAIGLVLFIVPGIILLVIYWFYGYAIADRDDSVGDSFSRSSEITKGQRGTVFLLGLAAVGINIVGALLCGVGLLVSYPVTFMASAYAYRVLSDEPVAPIAA